MNYYELCEWDRAHYDAWCAIGRAVNMVAPDPRARQGTVWNDTPRRAVVADWRTPLIEMPVRRNDLDLAECGGWTSCVSDRVKQVIERYSGGELQWVPVTLHAGGKIVPLNPYWICIPCRAVDCLSATKSDVGRRARLYGAHGDVPAGLGYVAVRSLMPDRLHVFRPRFTSPDCLIVSEELRNAIDAIKPAGIFWEKVAQTSRVEDPRREELKLPVASTKLQKARAFAAPTIDVETKRRIWDEYQVVAKEREAAFAFLTPLVGKKKVKFVEIGRPATTESVKELEALIGRTLPKSFRDFVSLCGHATVEGIEILGVAPKDQAKPSALAQTNIARNAYGDLWPRARLAIALDGRGGDIALDLAGGDENDAPVVYHDHEGDECDDKGKFRSLHWERLADGFLPWLKRVARGRWLG